jgi:hypothetical protein
MRRPIPPQKTATHPPPRYILTIKRDQAVAGPAAARTNICTAVSPCMHQNTHPRNAGHDVRLAFQLATYPEHRDRQEASSACDHRGTRAAKQNHRLKWTLLHRPLLSLHRVPSSGRGVAELRRFSHSLTLTWPRAVRANTRKTSVGVLAGTVGKPIVKQLCLGPEQRNRVRRVHPHPPPRLPMQTNLLP